MHPAVSLREYLQKTFPASRNRVAEVFDQRMESRQQDDELIFEAMESEEETTDLLSRLRNAEWDRAVKTSSALENLFTREQRQEIAKYMMSRRSVEALAYPLVSHSLGIDEDKQTLIKENGDKYVALRRQHLNSSDKGKADKSSKWFGQALAQLSRTQLKIFFSAVGVLKEGEQLDVVVERYPKRLRSELIQVLLLIES